MDLLTGDFCIQRTAEVFKREPRTPRDFPPSIFGCFRLWKIQDLQKDLERVEWLVWLAGLDTKKDPSLGRGI